MPIRRRISGRRGEGNRTTRQNTEERQSGEYVVYARASTTRRSDTRIERQVGIIEDFVADQRGSIIGVFTEIGQAEDENLEQRFLAMNEAFEEQATLIVSSIDRFSRRADFVRWWLRAGLRLQVVDYPEATNDQLVSLAHVALERQVAAEERLSDGHHRSRHSGTRMGDDGSGAMTRQHRARRRARRIMVIVRHLARQGFTTLQAQADELTRIGVKTPSGRGVWRPKTVSDQRKFDDTRDFTRYPQEIWDWFLPEVFETKEQAKAWLDSVLSRDDQ